MAAVAPGNHGRRAYDQLGWGIRVVRELGFPIAVAWYLLARLPAELDGILARDRELRQVQHVALVEALREQAAEARAERELLEAHVHHAEQVYAVILDRYTQPRPKPFVAKPVKAGAP